MSKEYVDVVFNLKPGEQPPPGAKLVAVRQFQGCIVCGADSNLRCSSCAAHGLDWMKFCSAKCQKEVWFLHKRVCGAKAVPFRWPGLTKSELEDMESISKRDHKDRLRHKKEAKLNRKGLIPNYESIRKEGLSHYLDPGKDKTLPEEMDRKLVELRNVEFQTRTLGLFTADTTRIDGFIKGKKAICYNPFNCMIYLEETYFPGLAMGFPNEPEKPFWWDMFQHQFVIYYATLIHAYNDPKHDYKHAEMNASVVRGSLSDMCDRTHPGAWKYLYEWIRNDKLVPFPASGSLKPGGATILPSPWGTSEEDDSDDDEGGSKEELPEGCRIA